ncbi:unnamed protein product [Angiostrongylus costaricensis]|uniref:Tr-type G domain-containing protein n=1 Tax=Angiostrongylus costaricensis TaxID=334426 RepID=A0A0R3PN57_ANGCS|nr:unnamed protein product [Angiostrongylus costaricensis]
MLDWKAEFGLEEMTRDLWRWQCNNPNGMSLNVGVLGHVDSGKTTLTRALAEVASTAAFDKHADSSRRRNTIDLGFSSLTVANRRLVLIDCPGHAGLIKAVLAAGTVFDMALVVIIFYILVLGALCTVLILF